MPNIKPYFNLDVEQNGTPEASGVTNIDFLSPLIVTDLGNGNISVGSSGGGTPTGTPDRVAFFDSLGNLNDSAFLKYTDSTRLFNGGTANVVLGFNYDTLVFGNTNTVSGGSQNTVFGAFNSVQGSSNFIGGESNTILSGAINSAVFGNFNSLGSAAGNQVFMFGERLAHSGGNNETFLGIYNKPRVALDAFQIGNGTSGVLRANAFAVTKAGDSRLEKGLELRTAHAGAKAGLTTLVAGTQTVATTQVTANSMIFLTAQGATTSPGALYISARTPGVDFTITSTNGADVSDVAWMIVEPFSSW